MKRAEINIDFGIMLSLTVLFAAGLTAIYSAGHARGMEGLVFKQIMWFLGGLSVMVAVQLFPVKKLLSVSNALYIVLLLLLLLVEIAGSTKMGAERWIEVGNFQFQPSEIGKFIMICVLSRYYSRGKINWEEKKDIAVGIIITALPTAFVLVQPDLGTAVIYAFIFFSIIYAAGLPYYYIFNTAAIILFVFFKAAGVQFFISALIIYAMILKRITNKTYRIILLLSCAVFAGLLSQIFWENLRSYQQSRLLTFLNPEKFSTEGGWQIIQSKTAVFNGKITGSGFMQGPQTQLRFLPEGHNDFIFSVLTEEFGLFGVMILLLSFSYLFYRLFKIVSRTSSRYLYLAGTGIIALLVVQTAMNIYISLGMLPVTGLTLPFVSYGGTALVINMFMVGIIMSIGNQKNIFKRI